MNKLKQFVKDFTDTKIKGVIQIKKSFFKVTDEQAKLISEIKESSGKDPKYAGIFLGEEKDKQFSPSIALMDIIAETSERTLQIDSNSEWLFLCGRDIFGKSILKTTVRKGLVIVENEQNQVLGYGKFVNDISRKEHVVVLNIFDRGDFLRRERK